MILATDATMLQLLRTTGRILTNGNGNAQNRHRIRVH